MLAPPAWALIVALHARQRTKVTVPSLLGWERSGARDARYQKRQLPPWSLPLVLQLLAVAVTALALAEPGFAPADQRHVVIFVGSPDAGRATEAVREVSSRIAPETDVTVIDVRGSVRPVVAFARPARALDVSEAALVDSDAIPVWDEASAVLGTLNAVDVTVVAIVASDDTGPEGLVDAQGEAVDVLRVVAAPARPTVAVVAAGFVTDQENGGGWLQLQARSRSHDPIDITAVIAFEDDQVLERPVTLAPERSQWFEWRVDDHARGAIDVTLNDDDGVPVARAALALDDVTPVSVRVVGSALPSLERVLAALPDVVLTRVEVGDPTLPVVDLEIVHGDVDAGAMQGHRLYVGAVPQDLAVGAAMEGPWQTVLAASHPLLAPGASTMFDVETLVPARVRAGGSVLGWAEGWPAVQAARLPMGAEVVVAFSPEAASGQHVEWSVAALAVRLLQWIEPGLGAGATHACSVGRPCAIPERYGHGPRVFDAAGNVTTPHVVAARHGDGAVMSVASFDPWFVPTRDGWHRVEVEGMPDARLWVAADIPARPVETAAAAADLAMLSGARTAAVRVEPWRWAAVVTILAALGTGVWSFGRSRVVLNPRYVLLTVGSIATLVGAVGVVLQWPLPRGVVTEVWSVVVQSTVAPEEVGVVANAEHVVVAARQAKIVSGSDVQGARATLPTDPGGEAMDSGAEVVAALDWARALGLASDASRVGLVATGLPVDGALQRWLSTAGESPDVDVLRVATVHEDVVRIRDAQVLGRAWEGATVRVAVTLEADAESNVEVRVEHDGRRFATLPAQLAPGVSTLLVDVGVSDADRLDLELVDLGRPDGVSQRVAVPIVPSGTLRVAVVADDVAWSLLFAQLLEVHGIDAHVIEPASAPRDHVGWRDVDAVVLFDLPAIALDTQQQRAIGTWVERDGGGLLIAGGENAFGPGGYHLAVLDELSPLAAEIPMDRPDVAVVFVLDRSGSMVQAVGETTRLEIAREATWEAITLLDPRSQVGIVVFDSSSTMIHPVRSIDDRATVRRSLDLLTAGGGTALYPALVQAHGAISVIEDVPRHVVVMTDGLTQSGDFDAIMAEYVRDEITVSTVAIGRGASYPRLRLIAQESGGTFYESVDFTLLPSIMAQEVLMLTTDAIRREAFEPMWTATPGEFSDGVDVDWPALSGMVRTTPKEDAVVHAIGVEGDALLASWEVGLGRVAAFTSQPIGPWSLTWLQEPDLPKLWAQVNRWAAAGSTSARLEPFVHVTSDGIRIEVVARRADGRPATSLPLTVRLAPDDSELRMMQEVEPGLYVGTVPPDAAADGVVHVTVAGAAPGAWPALELPLAGEARGPRVVDHRDVAGLHLLSSTGVGRPGDVSTGFGAASRAWSWHTSPQWRSWLLASLAGLLMVLVARYALRNTVRSGAIIGR